MKKQAASLAIVVPVYNRAEIVVPTLASLAAQTLRPLHVILVDNASTDTTPAVLRAWQADVQADDFIVDILRCDQPGAAAARNMGLAAVTEPWTMFFDSDDTMPPAHAEKIMRHTEEADVIGWDVKAIDGPHSRRLPFVRLHRLYYDNLFHGGMATQRWAARTELYRAAGAWNDNLRYWDDIELGSRILTRNPRIARIGQTDIKVFTSDSSITASASGKPEMALPALQLIEKTLARVMGDRRAALWCKVKLAIECALADRGGNDTGQQLLSTMSDIPLRAKWAYLHTRAGLPGAARILKALNLL